MNNHQLPWKGRRMGTIMAREPWVSIIFSSTSTIPTIFEKDIHYTFYLQLYCHFFHCCRAWPVTKSTWNTRQTSDSSLTSNVKRVCMQDSTFCLNILKLCYSLTVYFRYISISWFFRFSKLYLFHFFLDYKVS